MGNDCQMCRQNFNFNQWQPADYRYSQVLYTLIILLKRFNKANECKEPTNLGTRSGDIRIGLAEACQCNGHSDRCS